MSPRFAISTATVVMLVVLRLNIGWHFFSEGVKHYVDPHWTSEPVLRAATGPLAPMYHAYLPDFHGMASWLEAPGSQKDAQAVQGFLDELQTDGDAYRREFAAHYELSAGQQKQAQRLLQDYQAQLRSWGSAHKDDLEKHVHEWRRMQAAGQKPDADDVPFEKGRLARSQGTLKAESAAWKSELSALESDFQGELAELLNPSQRDLAPLAHPRTSIDTVDAVMTWVILAIGLLLLVGLFTRSACLAGAAFLFSVVMTQPFWVSDSQPTFNQFVEMFALLTLATTQVGRWGGLDFFVHNLIWGARAAKGRTDVSES